MPWRFEPSRADPARAQPLSSKSAFGKRQGGKPQFNKHLVGSGSPICIQMNGGRTKCTQGYQITAHQAGTQSNSPALPWDFQRGTGEGLQRTRKERGRKGEKERERKEPQINPPELFPRPRPPARVLGAGRRRAKLQGTREPSGGTYLFPPPPRRCLPSHAARLLCHILMANIFPSAWDHCLLHSADIT